MPAIETLKAQTLDRLLGRLTNAEYAITKAKRQLVDILEAQENRERAAEELETITADLAEANKKAREGEKPGQFDQTPEELGEAVLEAATVLKNAERDWLKEVAKAYIVANLEEALYDAQVAHDFITDAKDGVGGQL